MVSNRVLYIHTNSLCSADSTPQRAIRTDPEQRRRAPADVSPCRSFVRGSQ